MALSEKNEIGTLDSNERLLAVRGLKKYYPTKKRLFESPQWIKAIDGVDFEIEQGKTFGLVGESGCGKTTVGKCVLRIENATAGEILYRGRDIRKMTAGEFRKVRRDLELIFQDPYGSIDPRQSVADVLREAIIGDGGCHSDTQIRERTAELLEMVELSDSMIKRYPHEMSGGQRQRLGIARALACNPSLIVCDEPVSALDVSIQAQIINLFEDIQSATGVAYIFIAHDLSVVRHIAHEIGVMYLGHLVEKMTSEELYIKPLHPYTQALLSAVPVVNYQKERERKRIVLQGEVPSPVHVPPGCPFHPRCPYVSERCKREYPILKEAGNHHLVACHRV